MEDVTCFRSSYLGIVSICFDSSGVWTVMQPTVICNYSFVNIICEHNMSTDSYMQPFMLRIMRFWLSNIIMSIYWIDSSVILIFTTHADLIERLLLDMVDDETWNMWPELWNWCWLGISRAFKGIISECFLNTKQTKKNNKHMGKYMKINSNS